MAPVGALAGTGCLLMALYHGPLPAVALFGAIVGLGAGTSYAATPNLLMVAVPPKKFRRQRAPSHQPQVTCFPQSYRLLIPRMLNSWFVPAVDGVTLYTNTGAVAAFIFSGLVRLATALAARPLPKEPQSRDTASQPTPTPPH